MERVLPLRFPLLLLPWKDPLPVLISVALAIVPPLVCTMPLPARTVPPLSRPPLLTWTRLPGAARIVPLALLTVVLTLSTPPAVASISAEFVIALVAKESASPLTLALTSPWLIKPALICPKPLIVCPAAWISTSLPLSVLSWAYCGTYKAFKTTLPIPESVWLPLKIKYA